MGDDVDVAQLPSLLVAKRLLLPAIHAVYFVLSANGDVLYLGRARDLRSRWQCHHIESRVEGISGARIAWLAVDDEDHLLALEAMLLRRFLPLMNERFPAGSKTTIHATGVDIRIGRDVHAKVQRLAALLTVRRGRRVGNGQAMSDAIDAYLSKVEGEPEKVPKVPLDT